ncbi:hypothetical protein OAQ34_00185 [Opitutales bacterium]|jgi:hypothetical protein|uniref:hypothetical protein n=1 Tax=Candidatus Seribacter sulfatis TaxID=3381756 RepID=UPI002A0CBF3D|nr:hypothetical protein [Opitutales bacterium]MDC1022789.1 hypothetical protein [bacterium]
MFKRILYFLSFLSALTISGMPLAIVQVGAWLNMIDEFYEETQSISLSVEWTFNGDLPCSVCQFVSEQTDSGKKGLTATELFSHKLKLASEISEIITDHGLKMVGELYPPIGYVSSTYDPAELPPPRIRA